MYPLRMAYRHDSRSLVNEDEDDDDDDSDMSVDIEKFDRQVALLTQANADLEREREYLLHEKVCMTMVVTINFSLFNFLVV